MRPRSLDLALALLPCFSTQCLLPLCPLPRCCSTSWASTLWVWLLCSPVHCYQLAWRIATGRLRATKSRARPGRKFRREPIPQNSALKPYLLPKVGTHERPVVFCETSYDFIVKVIAGSCNRAAVTFLVRRLAFLDHFLEAVVEVLVFPPFRHLGLVVEFNFVDQQAGKTLRLAVQVLILGRHRRDR